MVGTDSPISFCALTGDSMLFGDNGGSKSRDKDRESTLFSGHDREFVSSSGKVVKLRRRPLRTGSDDNGLRWCEDEKYGININALLDRIETDAGDGTARELSQPKGLNRQLWVEKWRPRRFLDLVGNEKTNRRVLRWLRQWSQAVFNESLPQLYENEFDSLQRPQKRILLLHGSPGIGKTSVAHVVARQAGYSVAEINASDERGGVQVKDKVLNNLFNHTFNQSPVCLVVDEIDGTLEGGFVKVLIDIVNADARATKRINSHGSRAAAAAAKRGKKPKNDRLLLRPIIAICNNLYAPALEKLRPHCEIVAFRKPADSSLVERLDTICRVEGLKLNSKHINDLMELSQGDVRNCVNNLQFLASGQKLEFDPGPSSKDYSWSWFSLVNALFQRDPHSDSREQLLKLSKQIEMSGNYDRIVQGCHSIYPQVKYSDDGVNKPSKLADWLYFHDLMHNSMFQHNGELLRYCGIVPLQFAHMFGDIANREDTVVKNSMYEFRESQRAVMDIAQYIVHQTLTHAPAVQSFTSRHALIFEVLPYMDHMISNDLVKCKDLKLKQSIYDILSGLLQFFHLNIIEKSHELLEGKKVLSVDPPIDQVVLLDPKRKAEVFTKRPVALNFLLAKFEENKARKRHLGQVSETRQQDNESRRKRSKNGMASGNTVEFFKAQYGIKKDSNVGADVTKPKSATRQDDGIRIWVRYKEGFSDAVRKTVSWNGLWT